MSTFLKYFGLLIFFNLFFSLEGYSQSRNVFEVKETSSLANILNTISSDQNVLFAYPTVLLEDVKISKCSLVYTNISELLTSLLVNTGLDIYNVNNKQFLIRKAAVPTSSLKEISGTVYDELTGEPLPFATIYLPDYSYGVFTDENGMYDLKIDVSKNNKFIVSFLGYKPLEVTAASILGDASLKLSAQKNVIDDITIEYIIPPFSLSNDGQNVKIGNKIINSTTSGIFGADILRNVQRMAGVAAHDDDMATLKIRGSNAEGSNIYLDGIHLYNITHYYGIFSAINSSFVSQASLYKNAQPIYCQDASGGILALTSNSNNTEYQNNIDISLLTASAYFDNALSDKWKLQLAGRSTYRNVNNVKLLDISSRNDQAFIENSDVSAFVTNEPTFKFYDFNSSLKYASKKLSFSINGFASNDNLINAYDRNIEIKDKLITRSIYNNSEQWSNRGASIKFSLDLGNELKLNSTTFISQYDFQSSLTSTIERSGKKQEISNFNQTSLKEKATTLYLEKADNKDLFTLGFELNHTEATHVLTFDKNREVLDYKDDIKYVTIFSEYKKSLNNFDVSIGARLPTSNQKNKIKLLFSPQVVGVLHLNENEDLKFSYNYSNQLLRELEYESRFGQNYSFYRISKGKAFPILSTSKFMIGYSLGNSNFAFDLEIYYKMINGVIQLTSEKTGFDNIANIPNQGDFELFIGQRKVKGMDFSFSYRNKSFTSILAYTLSKSEDRYNNFFQGRYFLSQDDRRHQINWSNNYKISKFEFNNALTFASGRPYIAFENLPDIENKNNLEPGLNQRLLPSYIRWDIGVEYNFKIAKSYAAFGITVFNLTDRQNVKFIQYAHQIINDNTNGPKSLILGTQGDLLNRTLNFNFKLNF